MATFKAFEEIEAWQKARDLARAVYACSSKGAFAKDFGLRDQIRRATVSIMSNIAEGFERGGTSEFVQFLSVAKASTGEVEAQLYVVLDQNYISEQDFQPLLELTSSIKKMIAGLMNYLRRSGLKGGKYMPPRNEVQTPNEQPENMDREPETQNPEPST